MTQGRLDAINHPVDKGLPRPVPRPGRSMSAPAPCSGEPEASGPSGAMGRERTQASKGLYGESRSRNGGKLSEKFACLSLELTDSGFLCGIARSDGPVSCRLMAILRQVPARQSK
jgi:hypothetical protein